METPVYIGVCGILSPVGDLEKRLEAKGVKKVHLAPFMLVAEVMQQMICVRMKKVHGTSLQKKGYQVETHLIGLRGIPKFQNSMFNT